MHCTNCGNALTEGAAFCAGCGAPLVSKPKPPAIRPVFKVLLGLLVVLFVVGLLNQEKENPAIEKARVRDRAAAANVSPAAASPVVTWQALKSWSGTGMKDTESFEPAGREWRITWTMSDPAFAGAGIFQIYVHDASDKLIALAANTQQPGSDTSYVRASGKFYLKISAANCRWKVTVEEQR